MEEKSFALKTFFKEITTDNKVISIIGLEKNTGKTTFLNYLLEGLNEINSNPLVLSIGRDGEDQDRLENTKKPRIKIFKGQYFISIDSLISNSASIEVLDSFNYSVSGSTLFLARARQDTCVELINPGSIDFVREIIESVQKQFHISPVLIDGALDRKSHASSRITDGVFICSGSQVEGTIDEILKKTEILVDRLEKRECNDEIKKVIQSDMSLSGYLVIRDGKIVYSDKNTLLEMNSPEKGLHDGDTIYTTGMLTNSSAVKLLNSDKKISIVVDDGTKLMIDRSTEKRLSRNGVNLYLQYSIQVYGIILNSIGIRRSLNPSRLLSRFKERFSDRITLDLQFID
ncbi:MAG TPA: hypothetical protein PK466_04475 [Thermotogota bacterium]|nr:hypothetical protein [Thermotogota bacterium]HPR95561.1 hypothetical protein [Thermotogota bacterium]